MAKRRQHHSAMFTKGTGQVDSLSLLVDGLDMQQDHGDFCASPLYCASTQNVYRAS